MDFQEIIDNNLKDHLVISDFNEAAFKDVELCLGIDEAGRGPVLGKKKHLNYKIIINTTLNKFNF